jgi:predicted regulator of Ras-like GTPase activity (Roadblock/LC7/MglB family)
VSSKMLDQFNLHLQHIKAVPGVENSVLVQKDGYPISSAGVWLSENEIFGLSSSAAAILSVAQRLHDDLSYVLIEGERSKFLLATLPRSMDYFITVTTQSHSNLGALLLQLERTISYLDDALLNERFIPPLRTFEQSERAQICNAFNIREGPQRAWSTRSLNLTITENTAKQITEIVTDFLQALPSATTGEVCLEGGYLIPTQRYNEGMRIRNSTLTYTLFDTSRKVAQLVKRTGILQVLCDCGTKQHFIYRLARGHFSTLIRKDSTHLGLLRLIIPNFIAEIESVLKKAPISERPSIDMDGFLEAIAR